MLWTCRLGHRIYSARGRMQPTTKCHLIITGSCAGTGLIDFSAAALNIACVYQNVKYLEAQQSHLYQEGHLYGNIWSRFFFHVSKLIGLFTHEKLAQMTNIRALCPRRPIDHYAGLLIESRHKWNHDYLLIWVSWSQLLTAPCCSQNDLLCHKHPGPRNK